MDDSFSWSIFCQYDCERICEICICAWLVLLGNKVCPMDLGQMDPLWLFLHSWFCSLNLYVLSGFGLLVKIWGLFLGPLNMCVCVCSTTGFWRCAMLVEKFLQFCFGCFTTVLVMMSTLFSAFMFRVKLSCSWYASYFSTAVLVMFGILPLSSPHCVWHFAVIRRHLHFGWCWQFVQAS